MDVIDASFLLLHVPESVCFMRIAIANVSVVIAPGAGFHGQIPKHASPVYFVVVMMLRYAAVLATHVLAHAAYLQGITGEIRATAQPTSHATSDQRPLIALRGRQNGTCTPTARFLGHAIISHIDILVGHCGVDGIGIGIGGGRLTPYVQSAGRLERERELARPVILE